MSRIHTDSRSLIKGDLFVALKGDRFDGHDFLAQLPGQGVAVAIATRGLKDAGTAHGSQVQQLQAIMTLGWAALLLNEKVTLTMALIALGVIASVLWALTSRRKPKTN